MHFEYALQGGDFTNAGNISTTVKKILKKLSIEPELIKRIVIALYEAEINIVAHAYSGFIGIDINTEGIFIKATDQGPGIEDIEKAMQEGFSTASEEVRAMGFGAGMGLANIKKNADFMNIKTLLGQGTEVSIIFKFFKEEF